MTNALAIPARRVFGADDEENDRAAYRAAGLGSPASYATSATPFPRPDHKAKKHGRPKTKRHTRRSDRRLQVLAMAVL